MIVQYYYAASYHVTATCQLEVDFVDTVLSVIDPGKVQRGFGLKTVESVVLAIALQI